MFSGTGRKPEGDAAAYEAGLGRFHQSLNADAPDGFISSGSFRTGGVPWLKAAAAYEDWYLVTDFDALGNLNEDAIAGVHAEPHHDVAARAAGGTGGLYRAVLGQGRLAPARAAAWMTKPAGMRYPEFYEALVKWTSQPDITLWQRQLTLGPAAEFCLHAREQHSLPPEFSPLWVELSPAWLPG